MNASIFPFLVPITAIVCWAVVSMVKHSNATPKSVSQPDPHLQAALTQAEAHATRLEERIDQLERILDEDIPGWRARSSR
ncbi:envelope stress response membrane protein PspB [Gluconobacter cerinus]|uniref:envelope stress response membrane protein PspB n=1 Tax=Gluconobacter cerinus TaxID=38307 RepID=UPI001B8C6F1E|nr:envelope stress response membrane protein PspB [Gluconobacter cerinus]MBS1033318.1 envelope stress response membrane protein PspB [Gluconobacter cerinus]MBS1067952.1 envelope stress response membrane protein PspB [Gluconobacter cerinus]